MTAFIDGTMMASLKMTQFSQKLQSLVIVIKKCYSLAIIKTKPTDIIRDALKWNGLIQILDGEMT